MFYQNRFRLSPIVTVVFGLRSFLPLPSVPSTLSLIFEEKLFLNHYVPSPFSFISVSDPSQFYPKQTQKSSEIVRKYDLLSLSLIFLSSSSPTWRVSYGLRRSIVGTDSKIWGSLSFEERDSHRDRHGSSQNWRHWVRGPDILCMMEGRMEGSSIILYRILSRILSIFNDVYSFINNRTFHLLVYIIFWHFPNSPY